MESWPRGGRALLAAGGGAPSTRVNPKIRENANLAGAWSAQPVPASPPRAAHRPAAARAPRTTPGCTCGHASGRARTRAACRGEQGQLRAFLVTVEACRSPKAVP
jgi:hypothetical protein